MLSFDDYIAIYSRKSKFTGKGESIGNQVELCKEYVRNFYGEQYLERIVIFEDEGFSGGNLNRPDFQKMMKAVRKRKFKAIIVYRLDRISRNISDFTGLIDELTKLGVSFVSIREQFDTSTPMGRAMMFIISVFSQLERETIAERIRDNMHELAKTGRWLGGNTPTGFCSESVTTVTVDGKARKAFKLKPIPDESEKAKLIFDLYKKTDSLTMTESELLRRRIKTKNKKEFTRFSIKAILQNPVYMVADEDAYNFFVEQGADVCFPKEAFDGQFGIMPYNRTDQEKCNSSKLLPMSEWVIAVGKHPGLVPSKQWIATHESLERNRAKSYHKPRINEALLTGLIFCSCGNRMYPKLSNRQTANGDTIYTYVCKMKERSKKGVCSSRNANGNTLDLAVVEQVKMLAESDSDFIRQLEKSRQFYTTSKEVFENNLVELRQELADNEKKIEGLVDSLIAVGESSAKARIAKRIEALDAENEGIRSRITELEELTSEQTFDGFEFDLLRQLLSVFKANIDDMTIEQKRAAIRTVVRKIVWDGTNAHIILFGDAEDDIELPDISSRLTAPIDTDEEDNLYPVEDADDEAEDCLGKRVPPNASKSHWGEGSILHTPGGIGSKPRPFGRIKGGDALNEADGSYGDQVLLIRSLGIVFFHDVSDQAQIALNENIAGSKISFRC